MSIATPPRLAERLLGSLGADSRFHEALLGDLAEEFTLRAGRDGSPAATRWYWRETARSAPHALWNGSRALRTIGLRRQAGILLAAWFFTAMCVFFVFGLASGVLAAIGVSIDAAPLRAGDPAAVGLVLVVCAVAALAGGWIAASLDAVAPVASALFLGIAWSTVTVAGDAVSYLTGKYAGPLWYRVAVFFVALVVPALGGVLHVRSFPGATVSPPPAR